jgi:hypothetical protein
MNIELLSKANNKSIESIKLEAENNLQAIHRVEDIITSKLNNLLNICITFFIITSGCLVKLVSDNNFTIIFILTTLVVSLIIVVVSLVYSSTLPKNTIIIGSEPIKLINEKIIFGHENDYFRIISNRVYNLQNAIDKANASYKKRKDALNVANKTLLIGLVSILFIGALLFIFQSCQC